MYGSNIAKRHAGRTECPSSSGRWADEIEQRLIRAYFRLVRATDHSGQLRTITVVRLGPLEVRLTKVPRENVLSDAPPFWLEVFSPASPAAMESLGCFNFNDRELAAAARFVLGTGRGTRARRQNRIIPCVC